MGYFNLLKSLRILFGDLEIVFLSYNNRSEQIYGNMVSFKGTVNAEATPCKAVNAQVPWNPLSDQE